MNGSYKNTPKGNSETNGLDSDQAFAARVIPSCAYQLIGAARSENTLA